MSRRSKEDTGDRLIEILCKVSCKGDEDFGNCPYRIGGSCSKIQRLEMCAVFAIADHLLAEGVIVPNAKIGDALYIVRSNRVVEHEIEKIEINSDGLTYAFNWRGMGYEWVSDTDFGKTVFLTREEAERTLKWKTKGGAENG